MRASAEFSLATAEFKSDPTCDSRPARRKLRIIDAVFEIGKMPKVTVWERYNENAERWEHNHVSEFNHKKLTEPKPSNALQKKSWGGAKWRSRSGVIDDANVIGDIGPVETS